ncbi:MAG: NTP transferase domain-containing protein [Desulfobulbaceae bacterium]|uniref:NTP transferase domain-containing protein n=1 Tax=Candidatus Desulfatifera sulfidica TaxID=2841691 RepID=A0A8J6NAF0_9BACT|nr:NTP transferase domain-containing protein [Candidatus Desulfatifera sulfidica]
MQAMILAAGFGTRLLPYTHVRPKPLFPILNHPLLLLTIRRLQAAGFDHIVVNAHHLADQIVAAVDGLAGVEVQVEERELGTGGGLRRALSRFRDEPLLVTNGDIYHTIDYQLFYNLHLAGSDPVTLALRNEPRFNKVLIQLDQVQNFDCDGLSECLAFTGLHVLEPQVLQSIAEGRPSCILDCYRDLLSAGGSIGVFRADHWYWTDMGTPEDYLDLHGGLLQGAIPLWEELDGAGFPFCLDPGVVPGVDLQLTEWAAIGSAKLGAGVHVERSVVWDGADLAPDSHVVDLIVTPQPVSPEP